VKVKASAERQRLVRPAKAEYEPPKVKVKAKDST
jgi:hypothetical protein